MVVTQLAEFDQIKVKGMDGSLSTVALQPKQTSFIGQNQRGEYQITIDGTEEQAEAWILTLGKGKHGFNPRYTIKEEEEGKTTITFHDRRLEITSPLRLQE